MQSECKSQQSFPNVLLFQNKVLEQKPNKGLDPTHTQRSEVAVDTEPPVGESERKKLTELIRQRDNEISILSVSVYACIQIYDIVYYIFVTDRKIQLSVLWSHQ